MKKREKSHSTLLTYFTGLVLGVLSSAALADSNPLPELVYDPDIFNLLGSGTGSASTVMGQMQTSYEKLQSTYNKLQDQYNEIENLHNDIQSDLHGNYNYGSLFNDLQQFQWTASSWENELKSTSGKGASTPSNYQPLVTNYNTTYPSVSTSTFEQGATTESANMYTQGVAVNRTAITEASYQFNDIDARLKEIQDLTAKIDAASSTKEATDLNSRLVAEVAYIQTDLLRMSTLSNQQIGQLAAQNLSVQMQDSAFYASPDLPMEF